MVKDPRPPGSSEPQEALDLLRALARSRAGAPPAEPQAEPPAAPAPASPEENPLDTLRALAENLDRQLRTTHPDDAPPSPMPSSGAMPPSMPASPPLAPSEWQAFRDGLPGARALVPRLRAPQIAFVAIAAAVLAAAAIGTYIRHRGERFAPSTQMMPPADQATAPVPSSQEPPPPDVAAVKKAMSDCDAAAAQDPDSLYFLILPLLPTHPGDRDWRPVALQTIGDAYMLLGANDALDGVRDGKLTVRPGRYTFSVLDTTSGATYSWTSATGMIRLARKDSGAVKTLKLAFDFSKGQTGPQWSAEFKRDLGTCYWVMPLVHE